MSLTVMLCVAVLSCSVMLEVSRLTICVSIWFCPSEVFDAGVYV